MEAALCLRPAPGISVKRPADGRLLSLHRATHLIPVRHRRSLLHEQRAHVGPTRRFAVVSAQTAKADGSSAKADGQLMQKTVDLLHGFFLGTPSPFPTRRSLVAYTGSREEVLLMDWIEALINQKDYEKAFTNSQELAKLAQPRDARPHLVKAIISVMLIVESMLLPDKTSIRMFEEKTDTAKALWLEFKKIYDAKPKESEGQ